MSTIEHSVDVRVPVRVAYNQWTQFESFPEFMEGVESVKQITDTRTFWVAEIAGVKREFEAEIVEQHPDGRIAWRTTERPHQAGAVEFHELDGNTTRVTLAMEYDPEGFVETAGDWLQLVRLRVGGDMRRFKEFIETRGGETGAWRGQVPESPYGERPAAQGDPYDTTPGAYGETPGTSHGAGGRQPGEEPPRFPRPQ
ncbi:SRPBCC family protein [Nonomuraea sp. NBC_01738]|uniref:SRPBCC family protein n=1 Tax=Nonomuraea sp. NBC_01738 TaxID=2976003 RepID=UPI002E140411|nr:SRPBCC family protein [Nonomuraea sp. NBC_01738]